MKSKRSRWLASWWLALGTESLVVAGSIAIPSARAQAGSQASFVSSGFASTNPETQEQSDTSTAKKKSKKKAAADSSDQSGAAVSAPAAAGAPAAQSKPATAQTPPANHSGMVWVNTDSDVYPKPGSHWYGKTKQGKYMSEADAQKARYSAAEKEKD